MCGLTVIGLVAKIDAAPVPGEVHLYNASNNPGDASNLYTNTATGANAAGGSLPAYDGKHPNGLPFPDWSAGNKPVLVNDGPGKGMTQSYYHGGPAPDQADWGGNIPLFDNTTGWSIETWLKPTALVPEDGGECCGQAWMMMFQNNEGEGWRPWAGWRIADVSPNEDNSILGWGVTGAGYHDDIPGMTLVVDEWAQYIFALDQPSGDLTYYKNGVKVHERLASGADLSANSMNWLSLSSSAWREDRPGEPTQSFIGNMAMTRIYPFALNDAQVSQNFTSGVGTVIPPSRIEDATWTSTGLGDWNARSNWSAMPGIPNSVQHRAIFADAITSASTVTTDESVTVNSIVFDHTERYVVAGAGSVNLATGTENVDKMTVDVLPTVNVLQGSHQFQANTSLHDDTTMKIDAGATLEFVNRLSLNGKNLTVTGDGTLLINSSFNTGGGTIINTGGTIGGGGTLGGDLENNGGTISPGNNAFVLNGNAVPEPNALMLVLLATMSLFGYRPTRKKLKRA